MVGSKNIIYLNVQKIRISSERRSVDPKKVHQLAKSIKLHGLIHPIAVYAAGPTGKYVLSSGAHRLAACNRLKINSVPAVVLDQTKALTWEDSENLHRSNLTMLERADAIARYVKNVSTRSLAGGSQPHDHGVSEVARRTGFSRKLVSESLKIASLSASIKAAADRKGLSRDRKRLLELCAQTEAEALVSLNTRQNRDSKKSRSGRDSRSKKVTSTVTLGDLNSGWQSCPFRRLFKKAPQVVQALFLKGLKKSQK